MIRELDLVVLNHDIHEYQLRKGDIGTVVYGYKERSAFEVEFMTGEGKTIAVITLHENEVHLLSDKEIFHVREIEQTEV